MSAPLQVSIGELRDLAAKLTAHADDIAHIDPSSAARAATATAGSDEAAETALIAQLRQYEAGVR